MVHIKISYKLIVLEAFKNSANLIKKPDFGLRRSSELSMNKQAKALTQLVWVARTSEILRQLGLGFPYHNQSMSDLTLSDRRLFDLAWLHNRERVIHRCIMPYLLYFYGFALPSCAVSSVKRAPWYHGSSLGS